MRHLNKQKLMLRFLFIPLALILAVPMGLLTSANNTYAATNTASSMKEPDQVTSWLYYEAIMQCLNSGDIGIRTSSSDINANELFSSAGNAPALPYLRAQLPNVGNDQLTNCDEGNSQLTAKAFSFWGLNLLTFMCSLNTNGTSYVSRNDGQSCVQGTTDFYYADAIQNSKQGTPSTDNFFANAFRTYISSQVYAGKIPFSPGSTVDALTDAQKYFFYYNTALQACVANDSGALPTAKTSNPGGAKVYKLSLVTTTNGVAVVTTQYFIGNKNLSDGVSAYPGGLGSVVGGGDHNWHLTCQQLQDRANAVAGNVITKSNNDAAALACANEGVSADVQACITGAENQTQNADWCKARNWNLFAANVDLSATTKDKMDAACIFGLTVGKNAVIPVESNSSTCTTTDTTGCNNNKASCAIPNIGWIICPVFNFLAGVADATYGIIQGLLVTSTDIVSTDGGAYRGWQLMRTFADIGFVIVFLIIIFSQISGVGVTNYGVKKMLPRLIVAAILVNVSFFIAQIAVDFSNILGGSLKTLLDNINTTSTATSANDLATGTPFTDVTTGILGATAGVGVLAGVGAAIYFGGAGLLIPILLAAVLAILVTVLILIARQAIIILLIVVSPLAFLAMLLPNTENYFKQWRKIFVSMLIIYPIIALLFGASHLASGILLDSFGGTSGPNGVLGTLVALAVSVLPLFAVPSLLKGSLNAVPIIGGMTSKIATRANGLVGRQAKQGYQRSTFGQSAAIRRQAKDKYRQGKFAEGASKQGSMASFLAKGPGITPAQRAANKAVIRSATAASEKADIEEVAAAETLMRSQHSDPSQLIENAGIEFRKAVKSGDSVGARAAQSILLNSGNKGIKELHSSVNESFGANGVSKESDVGKSVRSALNRAGLKPKNNALATWAYNTDDIARTSSAASTFNTLSDAELAGHDVDNLTAAAGAGILDSGRAARILENPSVAGSIGERERQYLERLAHRTGPTPAP